ncbi:hypothetical protein LX36DRAFT_371151 [Colletotrichum falcatum]|nr:hypothetical protein LX36DRAFT_371151 [Colletotrichum falcatum]
MLYHPQPPVCFSFGLAGLLLLFFFLVFFLLYREGDSYCDGVHGSKGMDGSDGIFRARFGVHPRIEKRGGARKQQSMLKMLEFLLGGGGLGGVVAWWADQNDGARHPMPFCKYARTVGGEIRENQSIIKSSLETNEADGSQLLNCQHRTLILIHGD